MKKLTALFLSFLMVLSCTPADALASAASAKLNKQFGNFFADSLTAEDRALVWANRDAEDEDGATADTKAKHFEQQDNRKKRSGLQEDLEAYFTNNELLSSFGDMSAFDQRQEELAFYILNSDWYTGKGLSQGDKALIIGLVKLAQAFLGWLNLGMLDSAEASLMDKTNNQGDAVDPISNILESAAGENHDVDKLYIKIQNNAFHVVLLNQVDFEKVVRKYPEVGFLFDDLYTFFRWRYEMRIRNEKYRLNENNIYHIMHSSTRINSFFGWWELANVAKWFMANTIKENNVSKGLYPFTMKTYEEEKNNLKVDYKASARDARYFGRVWNTMQHYAAKKRHMDKLTDAQRQQGIGIVLSPKRWFKFSVRRAVYKSLKGLSDKEVYDELVSVRKQYVVMRARSEKKWQEFMQTQVTPRITEKAEPAWKEKLSAPTEIITDEDIQSLKDILSLFNGQAPADENTEAQPAEENFDEPEEVVDDNEPEVSESESEAENEQEITEKITRELKVRVGK